MMIDCFDKIYFRHIDSSRSKLCYNFLVRSIIKLVANLILPVCLRKSKTKYKVNVLSSRKQKIVISLTSFPARIKTVDLVIESILRQSYAPDKIILYLAKDQFPNKVIPHRLESLRKRGVDIFFVDDDIRPHKKYYYAFKEFPNDIIITVDDDVFYPSNLIDNLMKLFNDHPENICCNRACFYSFKENKLLPYHDWPIGNSSPFNLEGYNILPTGMGGVLYPPGSVNKNVFDVVALKENCINADDLWLNFNSRLNDTKVFLSKAKFGFIPILSTLSSALSIDNAINGNANDLQITNLVNKYGDNFYTKNLDKNNVIEVVY